MRTHRPGKVANDFTTLLPTSVLLAKITLYASPLRSLTWFGSSVSMPSVILCCHCLSVWAANETSFEHWRWGCVITVPMAWYDLTRPRIDVTTDKFARIRLRWRHLTAPAPPARRSLYLRAGGITVHRLLLKSIHPSLKRHERARDTSISSGLSDFGSR